MSLAPGAVASREANLRAVAAMVAAMLVFSVSDVLLKIVGSRIPVGEVLVVRGGAASVLILALAWGKGDFARLHLGLTPMVLWRSLAEAICSVLYFVALFRMALADAAAISQCAPLAVMAGAALLFGERVGWRRWSAAAVGFLGVLLIVKPGTSAFQPAALIMLGSMLFVAVRDLITRRLPGHVPTVLVAAAAMLAVTLTGALMAPFETWVRPDMTELAMLLASSLAVIAGFILAIEAMRGGDIGVVSPFRYSFMLFAALASYLVFGELPDAWSTLGIAMILGSGLYAIHRERIRRRERQT